jgi:streptogramin lyase
MIFHIKQYIFAMRAVSVLLILTLSLIAPITTSAAPEPSDVPEFVTTWGSSGSGDGQFSYPSPGGITSDSAGNIYVADTGNNRIQKFDSNGNYLTQWGSLGSNDGQFNAPNSVTSDATDNVYVVDTNNNRIQKFDSNGNFITKWGSEGSGNGQLYYAYGIKTDLTGHVYVADTYNYRIQKFDSDGTYLAEYGPGDLQRPYDVTIDSSGNMYVAEYYGNGFKKLDPSGDLIGQWGSPGSGDGEFYNPTSIASDPAGKLYIADYSNSRIQKFDDSGYLGQWGSNGSGNGQFNRPSSIMVNHAGDVYVSDDQNNRIQKFSYPPETATVVSAGSGADIQLESTPFTTFSCSTSVTEDSLTADTTQDYPLGLVDFCLDVVDGSTNTVSITFETDLAPSEVTARKYNPNTQTYTDVPNAEITETTLNSNPALKLAYDITDGGDLDDDGIANGTILDPVGLGVEADGTTSADTLADTGSSQVTLILVSIALLTSVVVIRRQYVK